MNESSMCAVYIYIYIYLPYTFIVNKNIVRESFPILLHLYKVYCMYIHIYVKIGHFCNFQMKPFSSIRRAPLYLLFGLNLYRFIVQSLY